MDIELTPFSMNKEIDENKPNENNMIEEYALKRGFEFVYHDDCDEDFTIVQHEDCIPFI